MATVVQSRFTVLGIVEDDFLPAQKLKKGDNKKDKSEEKKIKNNGATKKQQTNKVQNASHNKKKNHNNNLTVEQWEGKQRDSETIEDLKRALILSQLDVDDEDETVNEPFQVQGRKKKSKQLPQNDESTWEINDDAALHMRIRKEQRNEMNKNLNNIPKKKREPPSNEEIKGSKLQSILEKREQEISELKGENIALREELIKVKTRNKALCGIIGVGEMKDKAEVLMENEKLKDIQTELTNELEKLHARLEQERSKGQTKVDTKFKDKKKRTVSEKEL